MGDEPLRQLAGQLAMEDDNLIVTSGLADGFGLVGVSILDVTHAGRTVRVWDEGSGDFWFEFGDEEHAAWWRQDGSGFPPTKVVMALVEGAYEIRQGRVTVSVNGESVMLRESI